MIPDTWQEVALNTSPQFAEEIGFFGTVPCGHPISLLASVKNALRERLSREFEKLNIPRQRFCILYYAGHDPRACDGKIDMEVEWWGHVSVFSRLSTASTDGVLGRMMQMQRTP